MGMFDIACLADASQKILQDAKKRTIWAQNMHRLDTAQTQQVTESALAAEFIIERFVSEF